MWNQGFGASANFLKARYPTLMKKLCCLFLLFMAPAFAELPVGLRHLAPELRLQGEGRMTYFGFELYDARLYQDPKKPGEVFALDIQYLRNFKGQALADRTITEMKQLNVSAKQREVWGQELSRIFPDILPGQTLTALHIPSQGTIFLHNQQKIAQIPGSDFAKAFFGIWLDPRTSAPQLRSKLIANGCAPALVSSAC